MLRPPTDESSKAPRGRRGRAGRGMRGPSSGAGRHRTTTDPTEGWRVPDAHKGLCYTQSRRRLLGAVAPVLLGVPVLLTGGCGPPAKHGAAGGSAAAGLRFTEVSQQLGVRFAHFSGA